MERSSFRQAMEDLDPGPPSDSPNLTPRQREVLYAMSRGLPTKRIARDSLFSEYTVKDHISDLFRVLGISNRVEAVNTKPPACTFVPVEMRNNPVSPEWGPFRWLTVWLLSDPSSMDRSSPSALPQEITREIITLHARVLLRMPVIQLLFVGGVGWIVLPSVPLKIFLLWSFLTVSMECLRAVCAWWILPRVETLAPKRLHAMFMALDAVARTTVGLSGVLFLSRLPLLSQVLIEIIPIDDKNHLQGTKRFSWNETCERENGFREILAC